MYLSRISLENFRTFRSSTIDFVHPDQSYADLGFERPKLANVNLLLGNNGKGKTTLLKAIALAALGPAVGDSGIYPYRLIRREPGAVPNGSEAEAVIKATFTTHEQDHLDSTQTPVDSEIRVTRKGDLETLRWTHPDETRWSPIYRSSSDAFFFVGYGATRRVEERDRFDSGSRQKKAFSRALRVTGLFEESYSLIPLTSWLPDFQSRNPGRYSQVLSLVDRLVGPERYRFTGAMEDGEYLFERDGLRVPFPALSDGYRAFLGWVGDLLYHVVTTCPAGKKLVDNHGIVMVDEIDLHLHPSWQMSVLPTLAQELPNIQFIVTSHSPLIVGSLEWMNIVVMSEGPQQSSEAKRIEWSVHGLDADQVLLTDFFGLQSTRAPSKRRQLKELTLKARSGDPEAAKALLEQMSHGSEER